MDPSNYNTFLMVRGNQSHIAGVQSKRKIGELERQALKYNGVVMGEMKQEMRLEFCPVHLKHGVCCRVGLSTVSPLFSLGERL